MSTDILRRLIDAQTFGHDDDLVGPITKQQAESILAEVEQLRTALEDIVGQSGDATLATGQPLAQFAYEALEGVPLAKVQRCRRCKHPTHLSDLTDAPDAGTEWAGVCLLCFVIYDTPTPGACDDPGCPVLHDDPANPIHPPEPRR